MAKTKQLTTKDVRGVFYKGVLWYYDTNADFLEALPGFKLWMDAEATSSSKT